MKKYLSFLLALFALTANAQNWERIDVKGDALLGTSDGVKWKYVSQDYGLSFMEGDSSWKMAILKTDVFSPEKAKYTKDGNMVANVTIGFYDSEDNLVNSINNYPLELTNGMRVGATLINKGNLVYNVNDYLIHNSGYVRIVGKLHLSGDFDFRVPCINGTMSLKVGDSPTDKYGN